MTISKALRQEYTDSDFGLPKTQRSLEVMAMEESKGGVSPMQSPDHPFDAESLRALSALPKRNGLVSSLLGLGKIISIPLLVIGGGGVIRALLYEMNTKGDNDHVLGTLLGELLAWGLPFAIGGALWMIHEHFVFESAPLGSLAKVLFGGLRRGETEKVQVICAAIVKQTNNLETAILAVVLLRALALQTLAELTAYPIKCASQAGQAIPLFRQCIERGQKTPLVYFGLATSARLAWNYDLAKESYRQYLMAHPADRRTKEIHESLSSEKMAEEKRKAENQAVKLELEKVRSFGSVSV